MANGADGSIIIDTELDNTGFQRGSDKMEKATQGLSQTVNKVGQDMANAARAAIPAYQQAAEAIGAAQQSAQLFNSGMADITSSAAFGKDMAAAERAAASLNGQLQKLSDSERVGFKTDAQVVRFQMAIEKTRDNVTQLQQQLAALAGQKVSTTEYEALVAATQKAEQALFRMYDRRDVMQDLGTKESSREWQRLEIQIKNAEYALAQYERQMQAMQSAGTAFTDGGNIAQYQQTAAALQHMADNLLLYEQLAAEFNTVSDPAQQSQAALEGVDQELRQKPGDASQAGGALSRFGNILKGIAGTALRTAGALAKTSFQAIASGARKAASAIGRFARQSRETALTSKGLVKTLTSMKTLLLSRLKRTFLTAIINSVRESMQSLAKYSSSFNASMSSMKNAVKGLSGNIAVAFGNIINAVAPAITTIINLISQAVSYLNAFFAMLSGKSTVTVARKQTDDYAKSLGGAAGAAKELKEEVYGFDELNKATKDSSGGGGGGGGAGNLFEDVPIDSLLPDSVASFFSALKAAFDAGDWEGIGLIVADGLNVVIKSIDNWITSFQPVAMEWTSNLTRTLNGFVSGLDWTRIGKTISNGLNTAFGVFNTFLTTFDFQAFGTGIGNALNGLIHNLDWALIARTFANKWNAWINTIKGFVQTTDWAGLGSGISTGVNEWFATVDWANAGETVSNGIKGLLTAINTFLAEVDWQAIGNDVATFLGSIDWSGIVSALSQGVGAALGGLAAMLWGAIEAAWNSVVEWWNNVAYEDGKFTIQGLLDGIWAAICNIGQWIYDNIFKPFVDGFKKAFGISSPSTVMKGLGGSLIDGLLAGLRAAWNSITSWFGNILNGLKSLLSGAWEHIKSVAITAWTNLKTSVTTIFTNLKNSITTIATNVQTWLSTTWDNLKSAASQKWESIKSTISTTWDNLKKAASEKWESIKSTISTTWDNLRSAASQKWESIKSTLSTTWDNLKSAASQKWESIKSTIATTWDNLKKSASEKWESIKSTISTTWDNLKSAASQKWESIKQTLSNSWQGIKTTAETTWTSVSNWISQTFTNLKGTLGGIDWTGIGSNVLTGLQSGISSGWNSVKSWVTDKFSSLVGSVKRLFGISSPSKVFAGIGRFLMQGLEGGMDGESGSVFKTVANISEAIVDGMAAEAPDLSLVGDTSVSGLRGITDQLGGIAAIFMRIANMLAAIGGFKMPGLAAGTVVPYKTRVAGGLVAGTDSTVTEFNESLADQTEVLEDQTSILREMRDLLMRLRLNVDGDSIMQALNYLQRSQIRSYGGV